MSEDTETKETQADEAETPEAVDAEGDSDSTPTAEAAAEVEVAPAAEPEASAVEASAADADADADDAAAAVADDASEEPAEAEAAADEAPADEGEGESPAEEPAAATPQYDYSTLHAMNVAELREVASTIDHEAVHGHTTMHKEHLVPAICAALGIEAHEHHEVVGIDKEAIKARIRVLKKERDEAETAGDKAKLKMTRRRIRGLKRKVRKATV